MEDVNDDGILFNIRALPVAGTCCLLLALAASLLPACMPLATISVGATIIINSFFYFNAINQEYEVNGLGIASR